VTGLELGKHDVLLCVHEERASHDDDDADAAIKKISFDRRRKKMKGTIFAMPIMRNYNGCIVLGNAERGLKT